jgi:hypothetical protein
MAIKTTTMITIQTQVNTVILALEAGRLYGEPSRICNLPKPEPGHGHAPGATKVLAPQV